MFGSPGRLALACHRGSAVALGADAGGAWLPHPTALDGAAIQRYGLDRTAPAQRRRPRGKDSGFRPPRQPRPQGSHGGAALADQPMAGRLQGQLGWDMPPALSQERSSPCAGPDTLSPLPAQSPRVTDRHKLRARVRCASISHKTDTPMPCSCLSFLFCPYFEKP